MAHFPVFIDLTGKQVLIIGSGTHLTEKREKMSLFDCRILTCTTEEFAEPMLSPAPAFVILCDRHHPQNAVIARLCRDLHIPVNAVDDPPLCDFQFPALIRRDCLTVAVSTDGKAPAVGRLLREELEAGLPARTEEILIWSASLTLRLRATIPEFHQRGQLLNRILRRAFSLGRPLTEEELASFLP